MGSKKPIVIRFLRYIARALILLCLALFLLVVLIHLPFVQSALTGRIEKFLQGKTQTEITLERISLDYRGNLSIAELFIPDQTGDTLLHLGNLAVSIRYLPLIRKEIRLRHLGLRHLRADIHSSADGTMNYQHLVDAFIGGEEDDIPDKPSEPINRPGWTFDLAGAPYFPCAH